MVDTFKTLGGAPGIGSVFAQRIVVGVGDMAISNSANAILSTYALGSCVGVIAYDPMLVVGGLLHIMLPNSKLSPRKAVSQPSMFADTGLRAFLDGFQGLKCDVRRLRIMLAGGASVINRNDMFNIGERNITAVKEILRREGLHVRRKELGGFNNRTIHLDLSNGVVDMKTPDGLQKIPLV